MLLVGIAVVSTALVGRAQILIVNGASGTSETSTTAMITTNLQNLHIAAGNSVTISDALPTDISGYKQVWDIRFSNVFALTSAQQLEYLNYLKSGGGIFLMGENSSFMSRNDTIFSLISLAGGGTIGFGSGSSYQTVDAPFTGPNAVAHVNYAAPGYFNNHGTGQWITDDGTYGSGIAFAKGTLANAANGALTTILDVNFMQNEYDLPNSQNLTKNLIGFVGAQVNPPIEGSAVPEPATYGLMGACALVALVVIRRRKA